jgi:transposase
MRESPWLVSDGLWERVEPLLPRFERRFRYPGRKPLDERHVLSGILFVLHRGSPGSISRKSSGSAQG